jgi:hypothetical protein
LSRKMAGIQSKTKNVVWQTIVEDNRKNQVDDKKIKRIK